MSDFPGGHDQDDEWGEVSWSGMNRAMIPAKQNITSEVIM
jgi:hypothetical protein